MLRGCNASIEHQGAPTRIPSSRSGSACTIRKPKPSSPRTILADLAAASHGAVHPPSVRVSPLWPLARRIACTYPHHACTVHSLSEKSSPSGRVPGCSTKVQTSWPRICSTTTSKAWPRTSSPFTSMIRSPRLIASRSLCRSRAQRWGHGTGWWSAAAVRGAKGLCVEGSRESGGVPHAPAASSHLEARSARILGLHPIPAAGPQSPGRARP